MNFRETTEQKLILGKYNVKNARKPFQYEPSFFTASNVIEVLLKVQSCH